MYLELRNSQSMSQNVRDDQESLHFSCLAHNTLSCSLWCIKNTKQLTYLCSQKFGILLVTHWSRPLRMCSPIWGPSSAISTRTEKHLSICLSIFFKYFPEREPEHSQPHAQRTSTRCLQWPATEPTNMLSAHKNFCSKTLVTTMQELWAHPLET